MLWSSVSIPGKPVILMVDASHDIGGWESEFCDRLFAGMRRRGLQLKESSPVRVEHPEYLMRYLEAQEPVNCVLLFCHLEGDRVASGTGLRSYWDWFNSSVTPSPMLFAACAWEEHDPALSQEILESPNSFAPLAIAQQSAIVPRGAGLFFLKFFTELDLHSDESITGRMAWFSCSKARELLKRRRLTDKFGLRC